jgi:hypothetical protein
MAMPGLPIEDVIRLKTRDLFEYFCDNARYLPAAPAGRGYSYAIRLGSKTLFSDDTYDLRLKFNRAVGVARRRSRVTLKRTVSPAFPRRRST